MTDPRLMTDSQITERLYQTRALLKRKRNEYQRSRLQLGLFGGGISEDAQALKAIKRLEANLSALEGEFKAPNAWFKGGEK